MNRIQRLYEIGIEIESRSQSPRIVDLHNQGKHCLMGIGLTDPNATEFLFISRNPGGDETFTYPQDPARSSEGHQTMTQYLKQPYRHSIALRKFIDAFAKRRGTPHDEEAVRFGTTNMSYFYSRSSRELGESYWIEVCESLALLCEEIELPKLRALIFAGVDQAQFFHTLYRTGSPLSDVKHSEGKHIWMYSFRTTLATTVDCLVAFMVHPSSTRGISDQSIATLGSSFAALV